MTTRIFRYSPTAVAGIVIVAWTLTFFADYAVIKDCATVRISLSAGVSTVGFGVYEIDPSEPPPGWHWWPRSAPITFKSVVGSFSVFTEIPGGGWGFGCNLPFLFVLAVLFPIAAGAFVRFRFRLWQWLAYVFVIAALFALYLR